MRDDRRVLNYARCSLAVLAVLGGVRLAPSPYAPQVHLRWADRVSAGERWGLERQFKLRERTRREGATWAYDLADPSPATVRALVAHPAIADTHHIDREAGVVSPAAPRGTTVLDRYKLIAWRESPVVYWLILFTASSVMVSGLWLGTHRHARNEAP